MTTLVYILSASHSGSTLLGMLLGSHADTCTTGETKLSASAIGDLNSYRCSCGEYIRQCPFWGQVKEGMLSRGHQFDFADGSTDYNSIESPYARRLIKTLHRGRLLESVRDAALTLSPTWNRHLNNVQNQVAAYASTVAETRNAKVVVDSSKTAVRLKYLLRNPSLNVKIIRLIRDGRAVALTYMDEAKFADAKDEKLRGGGRGNTCKSQCLTMACAAYQWKRSNQEAEHVLTKLDESQYAIVRYEEYCSTPDATLDRLFTFLGLDPNKRIRDFRAAENHVVGNGMRMDTTSEITLDERWRQQLTEDDLKTFDHVAGEMNRQYGYK